MPEISSETTIQSPPEPQPLVKPVENANGSPVASSLKTALVIVGIIVAGVVSGWGISRVTGEGGRKGSSAGLKSPESVAQTGVKVGDVVGVADEKTFRDDAEGVLVAGGAEGEGSHHLLRPGGLSQNVYLTSSIVDLSLFEGHKIKVWGETFAAQKAGWLMDVGRVEVIELNSTPPFSEDDSL